MKKPASTAKQDKAKRKKETNSLQYSVTATFTW